MKLTVVGHSMIHLRQHQFFMEVARQGGDVLLIAPSEWGELKTRSLTVRQDTGSFTIAALPALGAPDMYGFALLGMEQVVEKFQPDVLYVHAEAHASLLGRSIEIAQKLKIKVGAFVWENRESILAAATAISTPVAMPLIGEEQQDLLDQLDFIVCGNADADRIHQGPRRRLVDLQVGVDTDHFQSRPDVQRTVNVGFVGRAVPEKGIEYLRMAWPLAKTMDWKPWREVPWMYSQLKVNVSYSQDTLAWREQAPPFVAVESMSCGCASVVSDGGAIPFWLGGGFAERCPGAMIVAQHQPTALAQAIGETLERWEQMGRLGRQWVEAHLSSRVVAARLIKFLEEVAHDRPSAD